MNDSPISVLVVDDQFMVRKGLTALLQAYEGVQVVGEAADGLTAIELVDRLQPDVVLMDLFMPGIDGIETIQRINAAHPHQRIIVLTGFLGEDHMVAAIQAGAMGYLEKDVEPEELLQSIQDVNAGEGYVNPKMAWKFIHGKDGAKAHGRARDGLTDRELDVLQLLSQGKTDQEMAKELVLAEVTIRTHISRILEKLGLKNRVEATLYAIRVGLFEPGKHAWPEEDTDL